ncbi:MAG: hypothetical protein HYY01_10850 [Chloroflexi bacterium]|nr:hypothetical protein [Chloroflexota bacterium]
MLSRVGVGESKRDELALSERCVREVSRFRAVKKVLLATTDRGLTIWTILDQEPSSLELRYSIYDIEAALLAGFPGTCADFRLVNLAEYGASPQLHLPTKEVIYERD